MKNKAKDKDLDAVKLMRDIRKKHYEEYKKDPNLRKKRLEKIRDKYKIPDRNKTEV